jgi:predicted aminopeptidase
MAPSSPASLTFLARRIAGDFQILIQKIWALELLDDAQRRRELLARLEHVRADSRLAVIHFVLDGDEN